MRLTYAGQGRASTSTITKMVGILTKIEARPAALGIVDFGLLRLYLFQYPAFAAVGVRVGAYGIIGQTGHVSDKPNILRDIYLSPLPSKPIPFRGLRAGGDTIGTNQFRIWRSAAHYDFGPLLTTLRANNYRPRFRRLALAFQLGQADAEVI